RAGAGWEAVHVECAAGQVGEHDGAYLSRVANELALGHRRLAGAGREENLVEVGQPEFAAEDFPAAARPESAESAELLSAGTSGCGGGGPRGAGPPWRGGGGGGRPPRGKQAAAADLCPVAAGRGTATEASEAGRSERQIRSGSACTSSLVRPLSTDLG